MAIITDQEPPPRYDWITTPAVVYRLTMDPDGENKKYELMPNIHCDGIGRNEGPHPGTAQFTYIFDGTLAPDWPHRIEHVQPSSRMRGVVRADDRLVVAVFAPNGKGINSGWIKRAIWCEKSCFAGNTANSRNNA